MPVFPLRPVLIADQIYFSPVELNEDAFGEPFFDDCLKTTPATEKCNLDSCEEPLHFIAPEAFIFHLSHCGSTLLAQSLATIDSHRVISEPEIINTIFLSKIFNNDSDEKCIRRLRLAIRLLLQPVNAKEKHAFIKFTSWNIFHAELIRKAFPDIPYIYIHREPAEVISSLKKDPNGFAQWNKHAAPVLASYYLQKTADEISQFTNEEFLGHMLWLHMYHTLHSLPEHTTYLIFPDWIKHFPDNIFSDSARLTVIRKKITQRILFNAKKPFEKYDKPNEASEKILLSSALNNSLQQLHLRISDRATNKSASNNYPKG
ncbi:MAG: sulfotransferase [Bacteroidia bacterium]|nr:sulfotransferase [Bacteroidia bacterium]